MCGAGCLVQLFWDWALILVIRYSGMRFLSGLWVLGFNPLSLDLAFIQIPFLEQVRSRDDPPLNRLSCDSFAAWYLLQL
jgi:hypothetical protein